MCQLMLTATPYIAIYTSIWTLNLRKTMLLIRTSKKESILDSLNEDGALTAIDEMGTKTELRELKNITLAASSKVHHRRKLNNLGCVGLILRGLAWQIKNAAVRIQYCSGTMYFLA